jgi:hypothetical protein
VLSCVVVYWGAVGAIAHWRDCQIAKGLAHRGIPLCCKPSAEENTIFGTHIKVPSSHPFPHLSLGSFSILKSPAARTKAHTLKLDHAKMLLSHTLMLFIEACVILLLTISPVLSIETVSITSFYPANQHQCVTDCIYADILTNIADALHCATPYANDCFCNTGSASASVATSWLSDCASSYCSAGDLSDDLTSMQSIYASYCIAAGFTQPGATDWYNPARQTATTMASPAQTAALGATATTTQVTVVTQTAPSTGGSAVTQPQGKFLLLLAMVMVPLALLQVPRRYPSEHSSGSRPVRR